MHKGIVSSNKCPTCFMDQLEVCEKSYLDHKCKNLEAVSYEVDFLKYFHSSLLPTFSLMKIILKKDQIVLDTGWCQRQCPSWLHRPVLVSKSANEREPSGPHGKTNEVASVCPPLLCHFLCSVNVTTPLSAVILEITPFSPLPNKTEASDMIGGGGGFPFCRLIFISFGFACRTMYRQLWKATVSALQNPLVRQMWPSGFSLCLGATPRKNSPRIFDKQLI